jgi:hypothetical protein
MRKSRFTESQIVEILKEGEAGVPVAEVLRTHSCAPLVTFALSAFSRSAAVSKEHGLYLAAAVEAALTSINPIRMMGASARATSLCACALTAAVPRPCWPERRPAGWSHLRIPRR